jgi:hypothetical protein
MRQAFIVRPFTQRDGIDFEKVEKRLISPALANLDLQGGTTQLFLNAGNIRVDMIQQLLTADIVIADVSVHNANVFYELGVRHALRPKHTYLLRARTNKFRSERTPDDEVPFDIKTERYLEYDPQEPQTALENLTKGLRKTLDGEGSPDSPVFLMLPGLEPQKRSRFLAVPQSFREDVEKAANDLGRLGLLALETRDFPWESEGLRIVGRAQFDLKTGVQSKSIWEALLKLDQSDVEANQKLGVINQRLALQQPRYIPDGGSSAIDVEKSDKYRIEPLDPDSYLPDIPQIRQKPNPMRNNYLEASNQALQKVVDSPMATSADRAEALSLQGLNIQDKWISAWSRAEETQASTKALRSPDLSKASGKFKQALLEDLNSFTAGLNALSLLTLTVELARRLPEEWASHFISENPDVELSKAEQERIELIGAVKNALEAATKRPQASGKKDMLVEIGKAELEFLRNTNKKGLAYSYESAISDAQELRVKDAQERLKTFQKLGVFEDSAKIAFEAFKKTLEAPAPANRVVVFAGIDIDRQDLTNSQAWIRKEIEEKLRAELNRKDGKLIAVAGASAGCDLIFHEVCKDLSIERHPYLALPREDVRNVIRKLGSDWEKRFDALISDDPQRPPLADRTDLPTWLSLEVAGSTEMELTELPARSSPSTKYSKRGYDIWRRSCLWLLYEAIAIGAARLTLLVVWDGVETGAWGDIQHLMGLAAESNARQLEILTTDRPKAEASSG